MIRIVLLVAFLSIPLFSQQDTVSIAVHENYPPFTGKNLANGGVYVEVAIAAFERVGYTVVVEYYPWARALFYVEHGRHDAVLGTYKSEQRSHYLVYSNPIDTFEVVLFQLKGKRITYTNLRDLKEYSIGVGRGYANSPSFDSADYLKKVVGKNNIKNFKKLYKHRVDLVVENKKTAMYYTKKYFPEYIHLLEQVNPSLAYHTVHVGISKNISRTEELREALNTGLDVIHKDGTYKKILRNHGF